MVQNSTKGNICVSHVISRVVENIIIGNICVSPGINKGLSDVS